MSRFMVKATVSVDVEISVEADTADAAAEIVSAQISMAAGLFDFPADNYRVDEDSVLDVSIEDVSEEEAGE